MSSKAAETEGATPVKLKVLPESSEREQTNSNRADKLAKRTESLRLAKAAQSGCVESFEKPLYRFLLTKTGDHHQAEDLLQDTFLITYRKLYRFNPAYPFSSWIFTIANRLAISHFRKQKAMQKECEIQIDTTPRCKAMTTESNESLWQKARQTLSENHYKALQLFYAEGMSIEEVAATMKRKPNSIKVWLHRARNRLANSFKPA